MLRVIEGGRDLPRVFAVRDGRKTRLRIEVVEGYRLPIVRANTDFYRVGDRIIQEIGYAGLEVWMTLEIDGRQVTTAAIATDKLRSGIDLAVPQRFVRHDVAGELGQLGQ